MERTAAPDRMPLSSASLARPRGYPSGCAGYFVHPVVSAEDVGSATSACSIPPQRQAVSVEVLRHSWDISTGFCSGAARLWRRARAAARRAALAWLAPSFGRTTGITRGFLADLIRTPEELRAENAFLRHQLIVSARGSKRPQFHALDRFLLLALSRMFSTWRDALLVVKPDTLLPGIETAFACSGSGAPGRYRPPLSPPSARRHRSHPPWLPRTASGGPSVSAANSKLGIAVAKRTVQRYLGKARNTPPDGQRWSSSYVRRRLGSEPVTSLKSATSGFAAMTSSSSSTSRRGRSFTPRPPSRPPPPGRSSSFATSPPSVAVRSSCSATTTANSPPPSTP